ncbi:MAG: sensor histidine kinase [Christensenellales bacterium]
MKLKAQLYLLIATAAVMLIIIVSTCLFGFRMLTYSRSQENADRLMVQASNNINTIAAGIENCAFELGYSVYVQELLVCKDPAETVRLHNYVLALERHAKSANANIHSVFLFAKGGGRKITDPLGVSNGVLTQLESSYDYMSDNFNVPIFTSIVKGTNEAFYYYAYIFPIYSTVDIVSHGSRLGTGIIILDTHELEKQVNFSEITENSLFMILDQENHIIVSNKGLLPGELYQNVFWDKAEQEGANDIILYQNKKSIVQCKMIANTGWKIVSVMPMSELASDIAPVFNVSLIIGILTFVLLIAIGSGISRNITQPVTSIVAFLSQVGSMPLKKRLKMPSHNEVGIIAANINQMLDKVEKMTEDTIQVQTELYESKLAEQRADLLALQSQINPHFLYNTLNCLSNIGLAYNVTEVNQIATAIADIFRFSIKGENMVSLMDEIECIHKYILIMNIRYQGKFDVHIDVDDRILPLLTLKMVLQPIVENAMQHGLEQKLGQGELWISGKQIDENKLCFVVEDNGVGMNAQKLALLRKNILDYEKNKKDSAGSQHVGLGNINKRIALQFGRPFGLSIDSEEGVGTKVTVILPVIRQTT